VPIARSTASFLSAYPSAASEDRQHEFICGDGALFVVFDALRILPAHAMKNEHRARMIKTEDTELAEQSCRAEFIFDVRSKASNTRPIKVMSDCLCDFRRPDWESRWGDWSSRRDPYLNLFLCAEHARKLGLLK
jgi:hypothetical protein